MESTGNGIQFSRRHFIEMTLGIGAGVALGACSIDSDSPLFGRDADSATTEVPVRETTTSEVSATTAPVTSTTEATTTTTEATTTTAEPKTPEVTGLYVPNWGVYNDIEKFPEGSFNHILLAFSEPDTTGKAGGWSVERNTQAFISRIAAAGATISLAVGGWGETDAEHETILTGFRAAMNQPDAFAQSVKRAIDDINRNTDVKPTGVDLDWEYPEYSGEPQGILALAKSIRSLMPAARLSIAVPSYIDPNGYPTVPEIFSLVDQFNIMTYDFDKDGTNIAKSVAPTAKVVASVAAWAELVKDESKLVVGLPTYGHVFPQAKKAGDPSPVGGEVYFDEMPGNSIAAIPATDTEPGYLGAQGWVSVMPPLRLAETVKAIRQNHPDIGGFFYWSSIGLVPQHRTILN